MNEELDWSSSSMTARKVCFLLPLVVLLLLLLLIVKEVSASCSGNISSAAFEALEDLYFATNGANWDWDTDLSPSTIWHFPSSESVPCSDSWQGLICEAGSRLSSPCVLNGIVLSFYGLSGTIPSSLQSLGTLTQLELDSNSLEGTVPTQLAVLTALEDLYLYKNRLDGPIPSQLGLLTNLLSLQMFGNSLTLEIPSELGNLLLLQVLALSGNLVSGGVPSNLGQLTSLQDFDVSAAYLTGELPSQLGLLVNVQTMELNTNMLEGSIFTEIGQLVKMEELELYGCLFTGELPSELGYLINMQELGLSINSFSGKIPTELGNLVNVTTINLEENKLSGPIISQFGRLTKLQLLELYTNCLTNTLPLELGYLANLDSLIFNSNSVSGEIPSTVGNLTRLESIDAYSNMLDGEIPSEFGLLTNLLSLQLYSNLLTGDLPSQLGLLYAVQVLDCDANPLSGSIPSQLGNLGNLEVLGLYLSLLTGSIPTELGRLSSLHSLVLKENSLVGVIPTQLGRISKLQSLLLDNNSLEGELPTELAYVSTLQVIMVNSNNLQGSLPCELGLLTQLQSLNADYNSFTNSLPSELGLLTNVTDMYFDHNLLSSTLPPELANAVNLQLLSCADNLISGPVALCFGCLPKLESIVLSGNYFLDTIPSEVISMSNLVQLDLSFNLFYGQLPASLASMLSLQSLLVNDNNLSGPVPKIPPSVQSLDLSNNRFCGSIEFLGNLSSATISLVLGGNSFSGALPDTLSNYRYLEYLNLSYNELTGNIEDSLAVRNSTDLQHVVSIDLSYNRFTGSIESSLFMLTSLTTLILSQNCFSGSLPDAFCASSSLRYIVLDLLTGNCAASMGTGLQGFVLNHYMQGTIPSCVWNSTTIRVLHLLGNGLQGSLDELTNASSLSALALGSNQLVGTIPRSFQQHNFEQLDLSINRLSGTLQSDLVANPDSLALYAMSVNRLSGHIPEPLYSQFNKSVLDVLEGNLFDCQQIDIPPSDASYTTYQCGSIDYESSLLIWIVGLAAAALVLVASASFRNDCKDYFVRLKGARTSHAASFTFSSGILGVCLLGLFGYITMKVAYQLRSLCATHEYQYWWTSTASFLHGWGVGFFVMALLAVSSGLCALGIVFVGKAADDADRVSTRVNDVITMSWPAFVSVAIKLVGHVANIIVVTTVNAVYIVLAIDHLTGATLLLVQVSLVVFKLLWSSIAIPWLILQIRTKSYDYYSHWMFMTLFVFIGAPIAASFWESSSCFLYVLTRPREISFSFQVPAFECSTNCGSECGRDCHTVCSSSCEFSSLETIYGNVLPPWIYSYQCSSAIITNYVPVITISYFVSGIAIPIILLMMANNSHYLLGTTRNVFKSFVCEALWCSDGSSVSAVLRDGSIQVMLQKLTVKYILDLAVLVTFGLAAPLLAINVLVGMMFYFGIIVVLLHRFTTLCETNGIAAGTVEKAVWRRFGLKHGQVSGCCYVVMGFIGVFWSLFMFDWIADVYGSVAGGLSMLVPLLMPLGLCVIVLQRYHNQEVISEKKNDQIDDDMKGLELAEVEYKDPINSSNSSRNIVTNPVHENDAEPQKLVDEGSEI
jgi:Leucine-rich repeat (LRR) protein